VSLEKLTKPVNERLVLTEEDGVSIPPPPQQKSLDSIELRLFTFMKKIDLNKIYFLSDQFGMRFIKPIKFDKGWHDEEYLVFNKYEFINVILNNHGDRGQQKLTYINNLLNNQKFIDGIFQGMLEVPQTVIDSFTENGTIDSSWPFINKAFHIGMVRMPDLSELREWQLEKLI